MSEVLLSVQARHAIEDLDRPPSRTPSSTRSRALDSLWSDVERFDADGRTYGRLHMGDLEIVLRPLDPVPATDTTDT